MLKIVLVEQVKRMVLAAGVGWFFGAWQRDRSLAMFLALLVLVLLLVARVVMFETNGRVRR